MGRILRATVLAVALCLIRNIFAQAPTVLTRDPATGALTFAPLPTSSVTVMSDGTAVGSRNIINVVPGAGVAAFLTDTGTAINFQIAADTALVQTLANAQSGQPWLCDSAAGPAYTCSLVPALARYTTGMLMHWHPITAISDLLAKLLSLDVDHLGIRPIKAADGVSDVTGLVAGAMYPLWFDGTAWRLMIGGGQGGSAPVVPASQVLPSASATNGLVLTTKSGAWAASPPSGVPFFGPAILQADGSWLCGSKDILASYPSLRLNPWGVVAVVDRQEQHATGAATDDWKYPPAINADGLAVIVPSAINAAAWKPTAVVVCHYALQ